MWQNRPFQNALIWNALKQTKQMESEHILTIGIILGYYLIKI